MRRLWPTGPGIGRASLVGSAKLVGSPPLPFRSGPIGRLDKALVYDDGRFLRSAWTAPVAPVETPTRAVRQLLVDHGVQGFGD